MHKNGCNSPQSAYKSFSLNLFKYIYFNHILITTKTLIQQNMALKMCETVVFIIEKIETVEHFQFHTYLLVHINIKQSIAPSIIYHV